MPATQPEGRNRKKKALLRWKQGGQLHARRWISESLAADRPIVRIVPVRAYQQRATGTGNPANPQARSYRTASRNGTRHGFAGQYGSLASLLQVDDENLVFFENKLASVREHDPCVGLVQRDDAVAVYERSACLG